MKFKCKVRVSRTLFVPNFAKNEMNKENIYTHIRKRALSRIYSKRLQMYQLYLDNRTVIVNSHEINIVIVLCCILTT